MASEQLSITVETLVNDAFGGVLPISWDNVPFDSAVPTWLQVFVQENKKHKMSLGAGQQLRRCWGNVEIKIYGEKNKGSKTVRNLADQVAAVFRDKVVNGVTFLEPVTFRIGEEYVPGTGTATATEQFWSVRVFVPFWYDEIL